MQQGTTNQRMPVVFLGHGSPMNALAQNDFTRALNDLGKGLPRPRAVVCISAHWETRGTFVTAMAQPRTIHDFGGFPDALYRVKYPAPGHPELARKICDTLTDVPVQADESQWGLDHGTWSVLLHLFPQADIPVVQLSLDATQAPPFHFELGRRLRFLREQGVLLLGSGNIVHNLSQVRWEPGAEPHAWAQEFDTWAREKLEQRDTVALVEKFRESRAGQLSVPTLEHYLPMLYILGASDENDTLHFDYTGLEMGALSMRCVRWG